MILYATILCFLGKVYHWSNENVKTRGVNQHQRLTLQQIKTLLGVKICIK